MDETIDGNRRRFLGKAAIALATARLGFLPVATAKADPRLLAAMDKATGWLNSPRLSTTALLGKLVIIQFGTYTCINWLRTLPYVRAWAQKYRQEIVLLGVHTPEFAFEKRLENVRREIERLKIDFPIAIDNDYAIWRAFDNSYWPALYFIDTRGRLRHRHLGEGDYEQSESIIQQLLAEAGVKDYVPRVVSVTAVGVELSADWRNLRSPEIYLGHDRAENFSSPGGAELARRRLYAVPTRQALNQWALAGEWVIGNQSTVLSTGPGRIVCRFHARDVHLVMGPQRQDRPVRFRVSLDGQPPGAAHGLDADDKGTGTVTEHRLYQLVRQPGPIGVRRFEIEFLDAGVEAFAFTFG